MGCSRAGRGGEPPRSLPPRRFKVLGPWETPQSTDTAWVLVCDPRPRYAQSTAELKREMPRAESHVGAGVWQALPGPAGPVLHRGRAFPPRPPRCFSTPAFPLHLLQGTVWTPRQFVLAWGHGSSDSTPRALRGWGGVWSWALTHAKKITDASQRKWRPSCNLKANRGLGMVCRAEGTAWAEACR